MFACHLMALLPVPSSLFFFFNDTATTEIYTLSLHDALPIWPRSPLLGTNFFQAPNFGLRSRSEEHTSELQSRVDLVCRLLLEKKKTHKEYPQVLETSSPNVTMSRRDLTV